MFCSFYCERGDVLCSGALCGLVLLRILFSSHRRDQIVLAVFMMKSAGQREFINNLLILNTLVGVKTFSADVIARTHSETGSHDRRDHRQQMFSVSEVRHLLGRVRFVETSSQATGTFSGPPVRPEPAKVPDRTVVRVTVVELQSSSV